jgi:hypothetical protein
VTLWGARGVAKGSAVGATRRPAFVSGVVSLTSRSRGSRTRITWITNLWLRTHPSNALRRRANRIGLPLMASRFVDGASDVRGRPPT